MKRRTLKEFVQKANEIHLHKYQHKTAVYVDSWTKLQITCPDHGHWLQEPANHLSGHGCPKCKTEKLQQLRRGTTAEFIVKSREVHGETYDYSKVEYVNIKTKVVIVCQCHGQFKQLPSNHLRGHGCPECGRTISKGEQIVAAILTKRGIRFEQQKTFSGLKGKRKHLLFDFWLPDHNTLIEYDGIQHSRKNSFTSDAGKAEKQFEHLVYCDNLKTEFARDNKYILIRIPHTAISEKSIEQNIPNDSMLE